MKVYDIKDEFFKLKEMMENDSLIYDEETGEVLEDNSEVLQELLNELEASRDEKVENIIYIHKELDVAKKALEDEAKRLNERAKMLENNQKRLKGLIDYLLGGEKIKTDKFTVFYGSSESVEIEDESAIPPEYLAIKTMPDKKALKDAIKNKGVELPGVKLEKKISVRWR